MVPKAYLVSIASLAPKTYIVMPIEIGKQSQPRNTNKTKLTLKQTHKEKGNVTMTISQEKAVRSQPQTPIPTSLSPAEILYHKILITLIF